MRRFLLCFFITVFCVADAFAAESAISRSIPTKNATESVERGGSGITVDKVKIVAVLYGHTTVGRNGRIGVTRFDSFLLGVLGASGEEAASDQDQCKQKRDFFEFFHTLLPV